ncbi:MAG: MerR family transcriptional regulator [Anaerolineae bacterium]|nr:MerR family transcriptional regulator [Anaerolineae bacterium]
MTVRTIRYYDTTGLLKPSAYSDAGRRLYSAWDYARLQQILTLKLIGLSLEEIRGLLTTDRVEIEALLDRQKQALTQQAQQIAAVIRTLEQAQQALKSSQTWDLEHFVHIIQAVNMHQQTNWFDQFLTDAQQHKLAQHQESAALEDQKRSGEAWKALFADIQANLHRDVHDAEVQTLVDRWQALTGSLAQGDADFEQGLNRAYALVDQVPGLEDAPVAIRQWAQALREAAAFIQRALAARNAG